jgi:hypothetical protein
MHIAQELVQTVRANVSIDWAVRENVRANLRRLEVGYSRGTKQRALAVFITPTTTLRALKVPEFGDLR